MKLIPPGDETITVGLTSGHTIAVKKDGTDVPQRFLQAALGLGCRPASSKDAEAVPEAESARKAKIRDAIEQMLDGEEAEDFGSDGKPDVRKVAKVAGVKVTAQERDAIWAEMTAG